MLLNNTFYNDAIAHPDRVARAVQRHELELARQHAGDEQHLRRLHRLRRGIRRDRRRHSAGQTASASSSTTCSSTTSTQVPNVSSTSTDQRSATSRATSAPIFGDPQFVERGQRQLRSSSRPPRRSTRPAARSGPLPAGNAIFPTVNQLLNSIGGIRTDPATLPFRRDARAAATSSAASAASSSPRSPHRSSPCRDRASSASRTSGCRR